jgi:hypothetical protein
MNASIFIPAGVFVILILTCLFMPIRLQMILNYRRRSIFLSWFVIALGTNLKEKTFEFDLLKRTITRKEFKQGKKARAKEEGKEKKRGKSKLNLGDLWRERDLLQIVARVVLRFLWDILRAIRWDKLLLRVDVSTPDPALTGILYGQLCAVKYSAEYFFPDARITVQPDFVNQSPKGSAESTFSIRPLNLIAPISKMFFALPKIQILKTFILKKRR